MPGLQVTDQFTVALDRFCSHRFLLLVAGMLIRCQRSPLITFEVNEPGSPNTA